MALGISSRQPIIDRDTTLLVPSTGTGKSQCRVVCFFFFFCFCLEKICGEYSKVQKYVYYVHIKETSEVVKHVYVELVYATSIPYH